MEGKENTKNIPNNLMNKKKNLINNTTWIKVDYN